MRNDNNFNGSKMCALLKEVYYILDSVSASNSPTENTI